MKEIVCLVARKPFLILVVACVVVAYLVMTGQKWQSPKPKPERKKAATKTASDQRKSVWGTQAFCDAVKMNGPFFPHEHLCGGMDLTVFLNVPFSFRAATDGSAPRHFSAAYVCRGGWV
jgi:hypothetical protein